MESQWDQRLSSVFYFPRTYNGHIVRDKQIYVEWIKDSYHFPMANAYFSCFFFHFSFSYLYLVSHVQFHVGYFDFGVWGWQQNPRKANVIGKDSWCNFWPGPTQELDETIIDLEQFNSIWLLQGDNLCKAKIIIKWKKLWDKTQTLLFILRDWQVYSSCPMNFGWKNKIRNKQMIDWMNECINF